MLKLLLLKRKTIIDESTSELTKNFIKASDNDKLYEDKYNLERELANKRENVNELEEQLKQKNPSYARSQQRFYRTTKKIKNIINFIHR
ncbi:hypothetical protein ['Camptotheca acuminata' phytoplasma]|uniref:hypothetical protein n=1 Tax='Camptotheca acuminata' phytoplasma TaxID=3239192 RepID=UPI00351A0047